MSNTIAGSAKNIYELICDARDNAAGDQKEVLNDSQKFPMLIEALNTRITNPLAKGAFSLTTLRQHIYAKAKREVEAGNGERGFNFSKIYLNSICDYVHAKHFEAHFGKFQGNRVSLMDEIKHIPGLDAKPDDIEYREALKELGIIGITDKLTESPFDPVNCMREIKHHLYFLGILGSKWVEDAALFREFLAYIESKSGYVRFLMINPKGESFKQLRTMRGDQVSDNSTSLFSEFVKEFKCLEVRFYDEIPCFRLIFMDNEKLALTRFKLDNKGYFQSNKGWDAPHLIIDEKSFWSLYDPFLRYYDQKWASAKPISEVIQEEKSNGKSRNRRNTR